MEHNVILHIPHSSTHIPSYEGFVVSKEVIQRELNLLTDWFTDELFDLPYHKLIVTFSRLFCDVERFSDDKLEVMSKAGMGMCYTHLDSGQHMRLISADLRNRIKTEYYIKHHEKLNELTTQILGKCRNVLIVDCHSFSEKPFNRDTDKDVPRPDFCIGMDSYHTPMKLVQSAKEFLVSHGYTVGINRPYSGTMIPSKYYQIEKNVMGIMIEVNRKLYLKEKDGVVLKGDGFQKVCGILELLVNNLANL